MFKLKFSSDHSTGSPNFCRTRMDFFTIALNLHKLKEKSSMLIMVLILFHKNDALYTKLMDGMGVMMSVSFLRDMLKHSYTFIVWSVMHICLQKYVEG